MTPDPRILEQNLAALVGRAYEPVLADEEFREALVLRVLERVTARVEHDGGGARTAGVEETVQRRADRERSLGRRFPLRFVVGAAASLAAATVLAIVFFARGGSSDALEDLLAGGRGAWRPLGDAGAIWRALDRPLGASEMPFAAETPKGASSKVLQVGTRVATLAANAGVRVEREPDGGVAFELGRGALELASEPAAGEPTWRLAAGAARVHFAHGRLRAEVLRGDPSRLLVFLADGSAWAVVEGVLVELAPGTSGVLSPDGFVRGGRVARGAPNVGSADAGAEVALPSDSGSDRAEVVLSDEHGGADPAAVDAAQEGGATLVLEVVAPAGTDLSAAGLASLRVGLVRVTPLMLLQDPEIVRPARRADGAFAVGGIAAGSYTVDVAVDGFALWRGGPFELDPGADFVAVVSLERGSLVRGVVVDPAGRRIAGAWVVSESEAPEVPLAMSRDQLVEFLAGIAVTDVEGRFELALRSGEHVLRAAHAEHAPGWSPKFAVGAGTVAEQHITLQCGATIRGTVERVDGSPWTGVDVVASTADILREHPRMSFSGAVTDAEGRYAIENLPPGSYAVLHFGSLGERVDAGKPEMRILDLGACDELQVDFTRAFTGARVFGRVTTQDGAPVAGMGLSLVREGSNGRDQHYSYTGPDGAFELLEVPFASYSIFLTPDEGRTVVKVDDFVVPEWVAIERNVSVSSEAATGIVRDGVSGTGLPRSVVLVFAITSPGDPGNFVGRVLTDDAGRFRFPHLVRDYYRLAVFSTLADFGQEYVEDVLPSEDGRPIEVDLHPGGRLRVRVVAPNGAPIAGAKLVFVNEVGVRVSFAEDDSTDAAGLRLARGVKPGAWTVRASAAGYADGERVTEVRANEEAVLEIVLAERGR